VVLAGQVPTGPEEAVALRQHVENTGADLGLALLLLLVVTLGPVPGLEAFLALPAVPSPPAFPPAPAAPVAEGILIPARLGRGSRRIRCRAGCRVGTAASRGPVTTLMARATLHRVGCLGRGARPPRPRRFLCRRGGTPLGSLRRTLGPGRRLGGLRRTLSSRLRLRRTLDRACRLARPGLGPRGIAGLRHGGCRCGAAIGLVVPSRGAGTLGARLLARRGPRCGLRGLRARRCPLVCLERRGLRSSSAAPVCLGDPVEDRIDELRLAKPLGIAYPNLLRDRMQLGNKLAG